MKPILALAATCLLAAVPAAAAANPDGPREFCAERPGLDTPPCVLDRGRTQVEFGLADWATQREDAGRTTSWTAANVQLRYGLADTAEVRIGWTAFGRTITDAATGRDSGSGTGDVQVSLRQNLANPDGSGFSAAVMPYVTIGTGGAIGSRGWSAGVLVPVSYDMGRGLTLQLTPELDAVRNAADDGRHLAYGAAGGIGIALSGRIDLNLEGEYIRDREGAAANDTALASASIGFEVAPDWHADAGAAFGLNATSPDAELTLGFSHRF